MAHDDPWTVWNQYPNVWQVLSAVSAVTHLLRTTPRGVYAMVERRQLPGVVRIRRRVPFRTEALLD